MYKRQLLELEWLKCWAFKNCIFMSTSNLERRSDHLPVFSKQQQQQKVISSRTGYESNHRNCATPGSQTTSWGWPLRRGSWEVTSLNRRILVPGSDRIFGVSSYLTVIGSQSKPTKEDAAGFLLSGPEFPWHSPVQVPVLSPPLDSRLVSHLCLPTTYCVSWCLLDISWMRTGRKGREGKKNWMVHSRWAASRRFPGLSYPRKGTREFLDS